MARFNPKVVPHKKSLTVNRAGGQAFKQTDKLELVSMLLTNFVQDQYYAGAKENLNRLGQLVEGLDDKKFAAKAAVYARTEFGMRSITHALAGEVVRLVKGENWTKHFISKVVHRPDDMTEILAYYLSTYGKPIPNSLKRGLGMAVQKFNDYQISKYKGGGKELAMVDVVNLVHPKSNETLNKLMKGGLAPADTWETKLTQAGQKAETEEQKGELKADAWRDLINNKKIGYFALLRNLRNIEQQAPDMIEKAAELLINERLIKKSLVFPFRFLSAFYEIKDRMLLVAVEKALDIATQNVPKFNGKTLVAMDNSGSMSSVISVKSKMTISRIASVFTAALWKSNNADVIVFSDDAKYMNDERDALLPTLTLADKLIKHLKPSGTNFKSIFLRADKAYDRIIILSDMQGWMGFTPPVKSFKKYKDKYSCDPFIYSFDLQGYGDMQFPEDKVACLAGFSDKVFDLMKIMETDRQALINKIEAIEL